VSNEVSSKKVLLFVTNLPENVKIVLSFLSKRDFSVFVETEIKEAVVKVFEKKPDFIFIAWDHSDKKIMMLPKLLEKSTASIIVPFINKNTKESILRFSQCPLNPKLYPPISGPAIERLILKHSKEDVEFLTKVNQFKTSTATEQEVISIQNNLNALAARESESIETISANDTPNIENLQVKMPARPLMDMVLPDDLEKLTQELEDRNFTLEQEKQELSEEQLSVMKASLSKEVTDPLTNILQSIEELEVEPEVLTAEEVSPDKDLSASQGKQDFSSAKKNIYSTAEKSDQAKEELLIEKSGADFSRKNPLFFKDESAEIKNHQPSEIVNEQPVASLFQVYCFSIVANNWCGYFVVSTKAKLDYPSLDLAFNEWLKKQFPNLGDITERDFFEFSQVDLHAVEEIEKMAEMNEILKAHNYEFHISLFSVKPDDMKVEFNSEKSYIKIFTRDIPTDDPIGFNLFLHLPENQKYLLYSAKNKPLNDEQKVRLLNKNITQLYTQIGDEHVYRKFLLRKTFTRLYQLINNKLSMI
jgi:hypothetical protein